MNNININTILERDIIATKIKTLLENFNNPNTKKGIYLYGDNGIGKTNFILNLLKNLNYDILYYDNINIRNKNLIDNISSNNLSNYNVYNLLKKETKKIVVVIDDIDGMNYGDKSGILSLIKLIRIKKTKKQKLENITNNPIICINNYNNDKKILELMKVCNVFELKNPNNDQLLQILNKIIPNLFRYNNIDNKIIKNNILQFLNNQLTSINKIIFYEKHNLIYKKFYINNNFCLNDTIENIKNITKDFLYKNYTFNKLNLIQESDRTTLSLLFHENILQLITPNHIDIYLEILNNFIFSDYIDRVIFQKQIWQLTEINYIIKLFYNNFILYKNNLLKNINIENIIFTKILTKYSSEYNNFNFIYTLLQSLLLEKKDIITLFYYYKNNDISQLTTIFDNYNLSKLEIIRITKFINQLIDYKDIQTKTTDDFDDYDEII